MFDFFANIFGYLLNFLYEIFKNYGIAIILFSIIIKIILLPLSIKQQKTMKKTAKIQEEIKKIQNNYSNNPEKMNQEMILVYKRENMSPFSGCLSSIIQIIILFSVFFLVRSPLTFMRKIDTNIINNYTQEIQQTEGKGKSAYPEIEIIKEKGKEDDTVNINMEFLGLDLSNVPTSDAGDWKVYVIPVLYVISSFVSIKITSNMQMKKSKKENDNENEEKNELDAVMNTNKMMSYMMPIMAISIAMIAPLGLALYWLVNNMLMIIERLILNKVMEKGQEEE